MSSNQSTSPTASEDTGSNVGQAIGGVFQAMSGAGEAVRGNINAFLDKGGEALVGKKNVEPRSSDYTAAGGHENIAQKGMKDLKDGLEKVTGPSQ
ncbi:hypothetical protein K437DRAFT_254069 [Tilletiaria anomala UBC 951]|uniref:Uncharacterized protein n=1 Tax=Tilletiaria anomala (strain ATCC 24038 / CBS 436.72 / UBC 951) TaxID=1037660 RepID=A0A066WFA4_TILAU|nr:uncharacterized protein K437DRAFT_254069 [Tilletiaria anomala UBC 951]KDN52662.1 hypothetical protein K437DRAFT_254069 [Tilletiaria anomala UBC 951]